ncbi:MAG: TIGR01459 family HAD-type hydrolase [Candidatus Nanopelagicales bacterium]
MQRIGAVEELIDRYDAVLCDVWGVLHDGRTVFPGVAQALKGVRAAGVPVLLLTNVPRPSSTMVDSMARLGFPADAWDAAVTSGDVIRVELARRAPGPMHVLGRQTDRALWDGLGLESSGLADARFVAVAGLRGGESPDDYAPVLRRARDQDLDLLCANPDVQVRKGGALLWCAGALAQAYEVLGGHVVQAGKPHAPIYERALDVLAGVAGRRIARERILAIGDGIGTDILGANRQGIDALFVATGLHGTSLLDGDEVDLVRAEAALAAAGAHARYAIARLR